MENLLEMQHISKKYPGVLALDDVSLTVKKGTVHALMGENGAGKSTLMKILNGVTGATKGKIFFEGKEVQIRSTADAMKLGISMIYQELNPLMDLTIAENIYVNRYPKTKQNTIDWKKMYSDCQALFDKWGLNYNPKTLVRTLKVADMQMLEIIKAISFDAKLIVMDEPSSAITEREVEKLLGFIHQLKEQGISIIIITHKIEEVFASSDEVTVLRDGQYIGTRPIKDMTKDDMISMMVGRELNQIYAEKKCKIGAPVLEAKNLQCGKLVNGVSFTLHKGEILGFAGIIGAGRTETMRSIFGLDLLESGTVVLEGENLKVRSTRDAIKAGVMMVTEDRKGDGLVLCRSIRENELLPSSYRNSRYGILNRRKEKEMVSEYSKKLKVKATNWDMIVNQLSGGNQQKVILAKWLMMHPKVLILDEPTRGIDIGAKSEIYQLMCELAEQGVGIILVSSELEEVMGMSDRILVMREGTIRGCLDRSEFSQEKIMALATSED